MEIGRGYFEKRQKPDWKEGSRNNENDPKKERENLEKKR